MHLAFPTERGAPLDRDAASAWQRLLERYLAGWAAANPIEIIQATAPGYRFTDPLVGVFTRWSLPQYFELLQARLAAAGTIVQGDLGFILHGPIGSAGDRFDLRFRREAPRIGLSGVSEIEIGERGVIAETVTYPDIAADGLCRGWAISP